MIIGMIKAHLTENWLEGMRRVLRLTLRGEIASSAHDRGELARNLQGAPGHRLLAFEFAGQGHCEREVDKIEWYSAQLCT